MKNLKLILCVGAASMGLAWAGMAAADDATPAAAPAAPTPTPMANPAMGATISANPYPATFDAGPLGKINVDGVITGMGLFQSEDDHTGTFHNHHNVDDYFDLSNAQVIINKSDGPVQFYFQAGAYSFPTLGVPYTRTSTQDAGGFGYLPQGFLKLVPTSNFSIEVGALPTLIGAELGWTFQNVNVERGLLWNTEPLVSKGAQFNLTEGSWNFSLAITDGYYTNEYSNVSGLVSYTFKNSDVLAFAAEGNAGVDHAAPGLANGQTYNLIYTHTQGPWMIQPYIQYQSVSRMDDIGQVSGTIWSGAILGKYSFNSEWSIAARFEYETSSGKSNGSDLLGFGPGSNAWSATITPTYQKGIFFARAEGSYVGLGDFNAGGGHFFDAGEGFGPVKSKSGEFRGVLESGFVF